ncbi:MAG TPA: aconitate hydratase AcnA [Planctomycetota bacterium]|jgi:aconitate hydratase|nr:aconitate hydratase AcnA [Planctomycetota bacterium]OQC21169.1 MAG: Aconitate hydratase [Planctomycetes bacterium ADurb.Bin069]NMD35202.1 aconitate hydratase AcnA [Planctomycetota bacterium]HNR99154.1 aconitate hydratase AcnA [Planctomycetota bacterium]HNU25809.1 aconitate hydratase AcnA [Planctomycetota bacterium]
MPRKHADSFGAMDTFQAAGARGRWFRLDRLEAAGLVRLARLPYSVRVLLENVLRNEDGAAFTAEHVRALAAYDARAVPAVEIPFMPARILMQDFTGVPAIVDLAALREAVRRLGGPVEAVNPRVRTDLVIDHSLQVNAFGSPEAADINIRAEYAANRERYALLKWARQSFRNLAVVPPGTGIVHQVNLERLAAVVAVDGDPPCVFPDTVLGTDSHTTMINGLGVLGWGIGGIEAEAVMLGEPSAMLIPEVIGVKLEGVLPPGATATDLVLTLTEALRAKGVVGKLVEYFGPGAAALPIADRAVLANMAPEYGATAGFFPVDAATLRYLRLTGRPPAQVALVEAYTRAQGLFRAGDAPDPDYSDVLRIELGRIEPCVAGPKRPQDRVALRDMPAAFAAALRAPREARGFALAGADLDRSALCACGGGAHRLRHGAVVIAAITSCTNTSNPALMLAAGILARKALARGIRTQPWVKTSFAPGSRVVADYLRKAGLMEALEAQGFHLVGYGCTTCIGNSGPLPPPVSAALAAGGLVGAAVLSGNRNFEGRIHPEVKANYLASPPLVVAYALAGRADADLAAAPMGADENGTPVFLADLWPTPSEIDAAMAAVTPDLFSARYATVFAGDAAWAALAAPDGAVYAWDPNSTYIARPPFLDGLAPQPPPIRDIIGARVLALLGDSVTTDHISPAGSIPEDGPAAAYLAARGVAPADFNSLGSRRGNHEIMARATFANIRLANLLVPGVEGGVTVHMPSGARMSFYAAAARYAAEGTPLIVIAGREYGTGSSRDWAAKGPALLGVRAVIAESFERIHRSNLLGMGILPLTFLPGESRAALGLTGAETYAIEGIAAGLARGGRVIVRAAGATGAERRFEARVRLETPREVEYYRHGGILPAVARWICAPGAARRDPGAEERSTA